MAFVGLEAVLHIFWIDSVPPVSQLKFDLETHSFGEIFPQNSELSGLKCEDVVAGRKRIDDGSFPGSSTR